MASRRLSAGILGALVMAATTLGLGAGDAAAAPARPFQDFDFGQTFATGDNCIGKAIGGFMVQPARGTVFITAGWISWTPKVFGPCSTHLSVTWTNFVTHRSGTVAGKVTDYGLHRPGAFNPEINVGSGAVQLTMSVNGIPLGPPLRAVNVTLP